MSSTSTSSLYSSSSRITALYSDLDTDALVESMCSTQQTKIDKQEQKAQLLEWKSDALSSISDTVKTFYETYCSSTSSSSLAKASSFYSYSITNLTNSSNNAVTLTADSKTSTYTGDISISVSQLAKNTTISSSPGLTTASLTGKTGAVSASSSDFSTTTLGNYAFSTDMEFDASGNISFTIATSSGGSQTFTFNKDTDTVQDMMDDINGAGIGVTISYNSTKDGFTFTAANSGDTITFTNDTGNAFGDADNSYKSVFDIREGTYTDSASGVYVTTSVENTALSKLSFSSGALSFDTDGNTSMTVNGTTFTFSQSSTISDVLSTINSSSAGVTLSFDSSTNTFSATASTAGSSGAVSFSGDLATAFGLTTAAGATVTSGTNATGISKDGTSISSLNTTTLANLSFANALTFNSSGNISFSINDVDFTFSSDTTLQSMLNTINNSDAGVTMSYSRLTDKFTITADEGGADSKVVIENNYGNAFGTNSAFGIEEGTYSNGQNALATITVNGETVEVEETSNNFSYDGINYTLNNVTVGTDEETLTFNVTRDYSATVESVKTFITAFNELLTTLTDAVSFNSKTDKDPDDYPPLTDAQKEDMSDEEIEKWEALSKDHILRNDSTIKSLITNLKNVFYSALGGTGKNATQIGITTAGYFDDNSGLFVLDEDALTAALEENGAEVVSMFTNTTTGERGLTYQINDLLKSYKSTASDQISTISEKIDDIEDKVDTLEDKLEAMAEKYYAKFAAMETALSTLNSQATALSSLLGS